MFVFGLMLLLYFFLKMEEQHANEELLEAAERGNSNKVRELLKRGGLKANPNTRDKNGNTPLHLAAEHGFLDVARLLLEHGADVNAIGKSGWTPLHVAAVNGRMAIVRLLLEHGADVDVIDNYDQTPSDRARQVGYEGIARVIEEYSRGRAGAREFSEKARRCPACGAPAEPGAKYCWRCGAKLA